jgi:hypothetical protein
VTGHMATIFRGFFVGTNTYKDVASESRGELFNANDCTVAGIQCVKTSYELN